MTKVMSTVMSTSQATAKQGVLAGDIPDEKQPLALVVLLENVGHIAGLKLPPWAMNAIDWTTEEYAKLLLRALGAHRRYDRVLILEDADATGPKLAQALLDCSAAHQVDVLLLVHGLAGALVGHRGQTHVGAETFDALLARYRADASALNLRMIYGVNCHGASLAPTWLALGAQTVNGALGVNWMPEPSLFVFLRNWLGGQPYSISLARSHGAANRFWRHVWRADVAGRDHEFIRTSRQIIFGQRDVTISS